MSLDIQELKQIFENELNQSKSLEALDELYLKYFSKKHGIISEIMKDLPALSVEQKKVLGPQLNELKKYVEEGIEHRKKEVSLRRENHLGAFYASLPGKKPEIGHLHITTTAIREIVNIFTPLGFTRVRYPEVDWEYFAFEALNMPKSHPARDEWETFFVDAPEHSQHGKQVITPHTSSGQVREMLKGKLPIRMLNISRCGRRQSDVSHNPTFFQFEGLLIDKGINISHLKGVLNYFAKNFFGPEQEIRLRPYDFRFTEPSFEVDITCGVCLGKGCRVCKGGWHELGGAGMVHPNVLKAGNIDPNEYSGFAFGWGVERTYMMKSGTKIDDIRHLLNSDLRFLEQF